MTPPPLVQIAPLSVLIRRSSLVELSPCHVHLEAIIMQALVAFSDPQAAIMRYIFRGSVPRALKCDSDSDSDKANRVHAKAEDSQHRLPELQRRRDGVFTHAKYA